MGKDLQDRVSSAGQTKWTLRRTWVDSNGSRETNLNEMGAAGNAWSPGWGHQDSKALEIISTGVSHTSCV